MQWFEQWFENGLWAIGLWCAELVAFVAGGILLERFARRHRGQAFFSVGLVLVFIAFSVVVREQLAVAAAVLGVPLAIWSVRRAGLGVGALAIAGLSSAAWSGHGVVAVLVCGVVLRLVGMQPVGEDHWAVGVLRRILTSPVVIVRRW